MLMPDHMHIITDGVHKPSHVLRYLKGIASRRIIDYSKERGFAASLEKLQHSERERHHKYSVWQGRSNTMSLISEAAFMQKVNYLHQNPVRAVLVERAVDYRWSSARCWAKCELANEPLKVDIQRIHWRNSCSQNAAPGRASATIKRRT
jgi:REP-associated tyrosine transposase